MENASKALIIAGAILLSILIIGIGMFIYNQAQEQINSSAGQMSQEEVRVFNSQFKAYEGKRISGSQVKQLLTKLATNAAKLEDPNAKDERKPHLMIEGDKKFGSLVDNYNPTDLNNASRDIKSTKTYNVEMNVNNSSNIIEQIKITSSTSNDAGGTPSPAGKTN